MDALQPSFDLFSRDVLEFASVIELIRPFLSGPLSEPALEAAAPQTDLNRIQRELDAVREARDSLAEGSRPGLGGLTDPSPILERLSVEGCSLTGPEILAVIEIARAACELRGRFTETEFTTLDALAQGLPDLGDLVTEFRGKILPDGSLDSSASPALARIRKAIEQTQRELDGRLEKIVRKLGLDDLLQDELVTLRNGRYVLPVKVEKKRQVEGVVHGASSSGQSVYVEPLETLPLNNELAELRDREVAETERILREFSGRLRARRQELAGAARGIGELDLAFAKAEFARRYGACIPQFSSGRELALRGARHPLLVRTLRGAGREPVPLTVELRAPQSIVIVSGPNTGGKTVALKTVGVAVLMAQAGLPVVAEEACLPRFQRVLADIGDLQSIERNLSTFSAHIRNVQAMTEAADHDTLALLDEIGGSTDPEEGAALAVAVLERFRLRGSTVFVSTHHSRLKAYAARTPGAVNASMDFDETTLAPTYRFLPGLPGKSSGLDIAERLGLDREIVDHARALLPPAETEAAALISSLHAKRAELEAALAEIRRQSRDIEEREGRLKREIAVERKEKLRELDRRLEETLREHGEKWKAALEEIRKRALRESISTKALAGAARRADALAASARDEWNAQVLESRDQGEERQADRYLDVPARVGDRVRLPHVSAAGIVTALLGEDQIEVEVGKVRMRIEKEGVRVLSGLAENTAGRAAPGDARNPKAAIRESGQKYELHQEPRGSAVPAEINLIGSTAEEARERVDEFLDQAFLAGGRRLRVIHGYGKGILRKTLHEMFASHPHVARFYSAPKEEGGDGATVVELKVGNPV